MNRRIVSATVTVIPLLSALVSFGAGGCQNGAVTAENCAIDAAPQREEGEEMEPGGDCISCHFSEGEGPRYSIAGTVMSASDEDDGCLGLEGITVVITDADGNSSELLTNGVGNFFSNATIKTPYTAKVVRGDQEVAMSASQTDTNCASCHTAEGANEAPGRIIAP